MDNEAFFFTLMIFIIVLISLLAAARCIPSSFAFPIKDNNKNANIIVIKMHRLQ